VSVLLRSGWEYAIIVPYDMRAHLHHAVTKTWWDRWNM